MPDAPLPSGQGFGRAFVDASLYSEPMLWGAWAGLAGLARDVQAALRQGWSGSHGFSAGCQRARQTF
ncbi:hypothetical protein [Paraburkholderia sp.]|uniref:hypothetical protein n=1 Tax=Paraburkholderia sp. TaxID=1926495 RepID=UPI00286ED342|nr:hypothetical protein [Paraburkholderia sp.]